MLSQAQINQFNTQGYLVVENLLDDTALQNIRQEYSDRMDTLYDGWAAAGLVPAATPDMDFWAKLDACYKGKFDWYQPFDISLPHSRVQPDTPMHFGPAVFDMATHPKVLDMVECLIGSEITSNPIQHVRIKPPERAVPKEESRAHIVATDWHQDKGVTLETADNTQMITVWLAITDATVENGCLQVIGGQEDDMLPHCSQEGAQVAIRDKFLDKSRAVPVPVKAGGAVVFHPLTPHASLTNKTDGYRWSFDLRYNVTGQPTGREHFPVFVARSRSNPASVLTDWQEWRDMWESTRATLAANPHVDQHRWPSDGPYCA